MKQEELLALAKQLQLADDRGLLAKVVISRSETLFGLIKYLGAAYLVWLGVGMLRARAAEPGAAVLPPLSDLGALRRGFLTNATNPKTTLFVVSLFTQVVSPRTPLPVQFGYGAFMSLAHLAWFVLVALAFSSAPAQRVVASARHHVERGIGGVLVCLGLTLAQSLVQRHEGAIHVESQPGRTCFSIFLPIRPTT